MVGSEGRGGGRGRGEFRGEGRGAGRGRGRRDGGEGDGESRQRRQFDRHSGTGRGCVPTPRAPSRRGAPIRAGCALGSRPVLLTLMACCRVKIEPEARARRPLRQLRAEEGRRRPRQLGQGVREPGVRTRRARRRFRQQPTLAAGADRPRAGPPARTRPRATPTPRAATRPPRRNRSRSPTTCVLLAATCCSLTRIGMPRARGASSRAPARRRRR